MEVTSVSVSLVANTSHYISLFNMKTYNVTAAQLLIKCQLLLIATSLTNLANYKVVS